MTEEVSLDLSQPYKDVDKEDVYSQIVILSNKLNVDPLYFMILINFETGGTFDPKSKSPISSARGLIQVVDGTAKGLVDKNGKDIKNSNHLIEVYPTMHEQLEVPNKNNKYGGPVFQYFNKLKPKNDLKDLILCNFYPYARNKSGYTFKHGVRKVNGGIKNVEEYVQMAIKKAKENGIINSEEYED